MERERIKHENIKNSIIFHSRILLFNSYSALIIISSKRTEANALLRLMNSILYLDLWNLNNVSSLYSWTRIVCKFSSKKMIFELFEYGVVDRAS